MTSARIALGRAGGSIPTRELLDFQLAHAAARDAVHATFDAEATAEQIRNLGLETIIVESAAGDRRAYLQRPDLGRQLAPSARRPIERASNSPDVALIVSDGLSARAAHAHAKTTLGELAPMLAASRFACSPVVIVRLGRVAIEDEIGQLLGAKVAVILLGERPGLGSPDSLGAYLVYDPRPGRTDAERNCVSNIRPPGLPPAAAARVIHSLVAQMIRRQISGVALKADAELPPPPAVQNNRP